MATEPQTLFDLIDSYWFSHQIFNKIQNPPFKIQKNQESTPENLDFSAIPTISIRSYSDQLVINPKQQSFISGSDLDHQTPKLETIFSGKESKEIKLPKNVKESTPENLEISAIPTITIRSYSDQLFINPKQQSFIADSALNYRNPNMETIFSSKETNKIKLPKKVKEKKRRNNNNNNSSKSKSLSELEFEEVKGFMDLGFMFSEKDKDSSLVSIIPGLQRLGKDVKEIEEEKVKAASRPYLSEAWSDLKNENEEAGMRVIKIPTLGDETEIKHQLRFWAHSVASVVR